MRKAVLTFALLALLAPFAAADQTPADVAATSEVHPPIAAVQAPASEAPAAEAPADEAVPADLEALFAEVDPDQGAEDRYLCMPGSCTTEWDCEMNQEPASCSNRMCDNPTGQACRGTCFCC